MGEKPSPSDEDVSRFAVLWNIIARLRILYMISCIIFVRITKYRKPVLIGDVALRVRELMRVICRSLEIEIVKGHVSKNHVHLLVSMPPYHSVRN